MSQTTCTLVLSPDSGTTARTHNGKSRHRTSACPVNQFSGNLLTRAESLNVLEGNNRFFAREVTNVGANVKHERSVPTIRPELLELGSNNSLHAKEEGHGEMGRYTAMMDSEQLTRFISQDMDNFAIRSRFQAQRPPKSRLPGKHRVDYHDATTVEKSFKNGNAPSTRGISTASFEYRELARDNTPEKIAERNNLSRTNLSLFFLKSLHGFPTGVAKSCWQNTRMFPLRIWIVDNSGSMNTGDGKKFGHGKGKVKQMLNCTRWDELHDAVLSHAALAKDLGAPILFRLLNEPNMGKHSSSQDCLPQVLGVCTRTKHNMVELLEDAIHSFGKNNGDLSREEKDCRESEKWERLREFHDLKQASSSGTLDTKSLILDQNAEHRHWEGLWDIDTGSHHDGRDMQWLDRAQMDLELLQHVMKAIEPRYTTPLAGHMFAILDQVQGMATFLARNSQEVVIVIATDGIPTDKELFLGAMHLLQSQPVVFIVRLCTDDEVAIHFWNTLDLDLRNINIEILDDFEAEAEKITSMNPWMNYAMPLQRAREFGFRHELLTALRERPLTHTELRDFCALLFDVSASMLPNPKDDWEKFYEGVEALLTRESRQWNPIVRSTIPWIDLKKVAAIYGGRREKLRLRREKERHENKRATDDKKQGVNSKCSSCTIS